MIMQFFCLLDWDILAKNTCKKLRPDVLGHFWNIIGQTHSDSI